MNNINSTIIPDSDMINQNEVKENAERNLDILHLDSVLLYNPYNRFEQTISHIPKRNNSKNSATELDNIKLN